MAHRLAPQAEADLDEIWFFVAKEASVETADRLIDSITTRFFLLGRHPHAGRRRDELSTGTRSFAASEYVVLYRLDGHDVLIQRVVHGSRDRRTLLCQ